MAVLTVDSLTGCSSIPSFLGGSGDTPANPSIMIFHQTSAPTNWTKVATWNDTGLRVIGAPNGTPITTGGTLPFTQTFASRSAGPFTTGSQNLVGTQISQTNVPYDANTGPGGSDVQASPVTIALSTSPPHTHNFNRYQSSSTVGTNQAPTVSVSSSNQTPGSTTANGSGTAHTHSISGSHSHTITPANHSHNSSPTAQGNHNHTYSGSYDFSITYVDIIIATKN
jgi:hypothetical protein